MERIRVVRRETVPWRTYVAIAVGLLAAPLLFYNWHRTWDRVIPGMTGGEPNSHIAALTESRLQRAAAHAPVADALMIAAARDDELAGEPVLLMDVAVRGVAGEDAFWVSHRGTPPIFVALGPEIEPAPIRPTRAALIIGRVERLPAREELRARWPGLTDDDLRRLERHRLYVQAERVHDRGPY